MIDISKADKAEVLMALYVRAKPQGMGFLQYQPGGLSRADALDMLDVKRWLELYPSGPASNKELVEWTFSNRPNSTIFKHIKSALSGKALFVTEHGYVGILSQANLFCAKSRHVDLELFLLAGGTHPVILSPVSGKASTYNVVAEAFVPQIMHGEVVYGERPVAPADPHNHSVGQGGFGKDVRCHSPAKELRARPFWKQIYLE